MLRLSIPLTQGREVGLLILAIVNIGIIIAERSARLAG